MYLDEAGTSHNEIAMAVAGVIVNGDGQYTAIQSALEALAKKHIPERDRLDFVFHATDIFHGSAYFDRKKWSYETRQEILRDLANLIEEFHLPVVTGVYEKSNFGAGAIPPDIKPNEKHVLMHTAAAMDCATQADRWISTYHPEENALIIAEDVDRVKNVIKETIRVFKSSERLTQAGFTQFPKEFNLPLKHVIDTMHFAAKNECAPLQLADLCAFAIGRKIKGKEISDDIYGPIERHLRWISSK